MTDPIVLLVPTIDDALRAEMIAMWQEVTELGGAVGARPGASLDEYHGMLDRHAAKMAEGKGFLYVMRDRASDELLGFAWWIIGEAHDAEHIATIKRLQISPAHQGEGLGRVLMDHLHIPEVIDRLGDGVDFLHLQYRAGNGLGGWYATYGYVHNVRWDIIRKNPDGSYGGWGEMIRTKDGSPMPAQQY